MRNIFTAVVFLLFSFSIATQAQIITTVAGGDTTGLGDGGLATACELFEPIGVAVDNAGNLYICDRGNNRVRKVNNTGIITTIAGTGTAGYNGDGLPATSAQVNYPYAVAIDDTGNVFIADELNNRIRKINTSGIITTIAGTGTAGYNGDNIAATGAELNSPDGIAIDGSGNVYLSDYNNNRVRKINTSGIITTYAGTGIGPYNGDNFSASTSNLYHPFGIALDNGGNLYIADFSNNRLRRVNVSGIITTIGGNGIPGIAGDGGPATTAELDLAGVAVDVSGNIYIGDAGRNIVRKINSSGVITTIAGTGVDGYNGDNQPATQAELFNPVGVAVDASENLYIADFGNDRIRYIRSTVFVNQISGITDAMHVYPNPSSGIFTINIVSGNEVNVRLCITNVTGEKVKEIMAVTNTPVDIKLDVPDGIYFLTASTSSEFWSQKIIVG